MTREELHKASTEKMKYQLENLSDEQMKLIHTYCDNNLRKLKKICHKITCHKPDVFQKDLDDIYDNAIKVLLEAVISYNPDSNAQFKTFLYSNLNRSFWEWSRDRHRGVRANVLVKNGKILYDEKQKRAIVIPDMSLDEIYDDEVSGHSKIKSNFDLDEELDLKEEIVDEKKNKRVKKFLENISKKNRRVAEMIMDGRNVANITEVCGISYSQYRDAISEFRLYENISILLKDEEE